MARQDTVHLFGRFNKANILNDESMAVIYMDCVRGKRFVEDHTDKSEMKDKIAVVTKTPELIAKVEKFEKNDIVMVKGTLSTTVATGTANCEHCGELHSFEQLTITVTPIDLFFVKREESDEEAMLDLYNHREFSNEILVTGEIRHKPRGYKTDRGLIICEYQMNIDRKFHVLTDDPAKRSDAPIVKSYGDVALDNLLRLDAGSTVLIDGFIQSRKFPKTFKCSECGEYFTVPRHTLEIVPYAVEYLKNYREDKDFDDVEAEKQKIYDSVTEENNG